MTDDVIRSEPLAFVPRGRKLETPRTARPGSVVYTVGPLTPADAHRLKIARQHFTEASEDDFDFDGGKDITDRATGEHYRIARFDPLQSEDPRRSGVVAFLVRDGWLVYLRSQGEPEPTRRTALGEIGGWRVEPLASQPTDSSIY